MAAQASVRGGEGIQTNGPPEGVIGGIAEFGNDIMTLAELQARLAAIDFKESLEHAVVPLVLTLGGLMLALASLPVVLIGVAQLIAWAFSIHLGWALLLVGLVALVGASAVAGIAGLRFSRSFASFQRSREELVRNLSWIRTVLVHSGRPVPRRGR